MDRDSLVAAVRRHAGEVPPPVQFELRRKVLHVVTAILAVPTLLLLDFIVALVLATLGVLVITATWLIERKRLRRHVAKPYVDLVHEPLAEVLHRTRRPGEDYPWSPVLYTAALVLIASAHELLGLPWSIAFAAYAILGIGDAASALVGVAYGRRKLPWNPKKSLEGTGAGLLAGYLAGVVLGALPFIVTGAPLPGEFLLLVLAGATTGALAETLPRLEDNFVVPITSAAVMFGLAWTMGVSLP